MAPIGTRETSDLSKEEQLRYAKIGYVALNQERFPFNMNPGDCLTPASAYFWHQEKKVLGEIPEAIHFDHLKSKIGPEHRERIGEVWEKLVRFRENYRLSTIELRELWHEAPESTDNNATEIVDNYPLRIREEYRKAAIAVISETPKNDYDLTCDDFTKDLSELDPTTRWQNREARLRASVYTNQMLYFSTLRIYLELLLEKSEDENEFVIPAEEETRREAIAMHNRLARPIDGAYEGIALAKGLHNDQPKHILRKGEPVPYLVHVQEVMTRTLQDVMPYLVDTPKNQMLIFLALAAALHDVIEDTRITLAGLIEDLERLANRRDTKYIQSIVSGFGRDSDVLKSEWIDLLGETAHFSGRNRFRDMLRIIRILTNDTELTKDKGNKLNPKTNERQRVYNQSIAGREASIKLYNITEEEIASWGTAARDSEAIKKPKLKTFQQYPEEYDHGKSTKLLMRLRAISKNQEIRQIALIIKLEDKAHNMDTLSGLKPEKQRLNLRAAVTRLLAFCMLDYNRPLYGALPRAIDSTLRAYLKFKEEYPELYEAETDDQLIAQLQIWQTAANDDFTEDPEVTRIVSSWQAANAA